MKLKKKWSQEWKPWKCIFSNGTYHSKGVAILIRNTLNYDINNCVSDPNGRFIIMDVTVNGEEFLIVNVYTPCVSKPKEQVEFWNQLSFHISNMDNVFEKNIICGGDINFLMNIGLDRAGGNPSHDDNVLRAIHNFLDTFDLVDIWRVRNPHQRQYTWRQKTH